MMDLVNFIHAKNFKFVYLSGLYSMARKIHLCIPGYQSKHHFYTNLYWLEVSSFHIQLFDRAQNNFSSLAARNQLALLKCK